MSISVSQQLVAATKALEGVSDTPRLDAELLMAHALGLSRNELLLRARDLLTPPDFEALLQRRLAHEPVAYIRGYQEFWDLTLAVTPATLIPRGDAIARDFQLVVEDYIEKRYGGQPVPAAQA